MTQTPNPGPSPETINAATADLVRKLPHSDGKIREKFQIGATKGRRGGGATTTTTTPKNLDVPFLGNDNNNNNNDINDENKSLRRGTRLGHNSTITSRAKHDRRHRSSSPKRKQQQQQDSIIVTTPSSSNRHRSKSRTSGDSTSLNGGNSSTGSPDYYRKNVLGQHLVASKSKVTESTGAGSCSVCESTAES